MDGAAASSSSSSSSSAALREETERLVGDYLEHRVAGLGLGLSPAALGGSASSSSSRAAETLRRVAGELERRERPFFRRACAAALAEEEEEEEEEEAASGDAAPPSGLSGGPCRCLARVAAQMDAEGGLNWGRVAALVAFAGSLAAARAEQRRAAGEGEAEEAEAETRRALAHALAAYLAGEKRHWLQAHGGWDGFHQFFNKQGSDPAEQNSTLSNAIMAAAGFGLAGLAFLLAVR